MSQQPTIIPCIVTTQYRGVFYAEIPTNQDLTSKTLVNLQNCRMAIKWGTTDGLMQLAATGPTENTKVSATCDIDTLQDVTAVFRCTPQATAVWQSK